MTYETDMGLFGTLTLEDVTREMVQAYMDDYLVRNLSDEEFRLIRDNLKYLKEKFNL